MDKQKSKQHTPGPWNIKLVMNQCDAVGTTIVCVPEIRGGNPHSPFFCITSDEFTWGDRAADAKLIAAAPDMLAAIELCVEELNELDTNTNTNLAINAARKAIAKATGGAA